MAAAMNSYIVPKDADLLFLGPCRDSRHTDFLILDVVHVKARLHRGSGAQRIDGYYSLDNRRLKCMKDAGRTMARVRVLVPQNRAVEDLINKADNKRRAKPHQSLVSVPTLFN